MNLESHKKNQAVIREAIADLVFGSDEDIAQEVLTMSDAEISSELAEAGINTNTSFETLRARLKAAVKQGHLAAQDLVTQEQQEREREKNSAQEVADVKVGADVSQTQSTEVSSSLPKDLSEARQTRNWTVGRLARELDIPKELALQLVRGYDEWPLRLTKKISQVFAVPLTQASQILTNTYPAPATQFKATSQPGTPIERGKSFQADLEAFDRQGKLTPAQRQEWLLNED